MKTRTWIVIAIVIIVVVIGAAAFIWRPAMLWKANVSVHDRAVNVIVVWANLSSLPNDADQLEVIWTTPGTGRDYRFYPDAAQKLLLRLQSEFKDRKLALRYTDIYSSSDNKAGKVKTVDDVAVAVNQSSAAE